MQPIDHKSSACAAGICRGVHYESLMKTAEANTHLRLLTGTILKSPVMQETLHVPGTEPKTTLKWGDVCKLKIASDIMNTECGAPLTLKHILEHVHQDELDAVQHVIDSRSKFGKMTLPHPAKYIAFGFIPKGMYCNVPLPQQKAMKKHMLSTATEFARIGLRKYAECLGRQTVVDSTPNFTVETAQSQSLKYEYLALADAALKPGKEPGEPCIIGLGGHITRVSDGVVIKQFMVRRDMSRENSTIAEHFAHLVLTKMTSSVGVQDVGFGADNKAVPVQNEGNCNISATIVRSIRKTTAVIKTDIARHSEMWFPREQNTYADELSKLALSGKQSFDASWLVELDELLREYEDQFRDS